MASGVEELLDMLFDMVDEAKNVPLSSDKCMIERDRALDLIDDIRAQFPVELSEAKKLMASRADMIASAKREADAIRRQAEEKAKQLLAEESILLQARQRANELMQQAEDRSRELKRSANDYCEDALRRTEEAVAEAYDEIKKSRSRFRAAARASRSARAAAFSSSVISLVFFRGPRRRVGAFFLAVSLTVGFFSAWSREGRTCLGLGWTASSRS